MKNLEINPLAVFGLRRLEHCPPHFVQVKFELRTDIKNISDWIWEQLAGRFWLDAVCYINENETVGTCYCAAFELGAEASYFSLMLDSVNHWNMDDL